MGRGKSFFKKAKKTGKSKGGRKKKKADVEDLEQAKIQKKQHELDRLHHSIDRAVHQVVFGCPFCRHCGLR